MSLRLDNRLRQPVQQGAKVVAVPHIGPQHQRVDEEADQILQLAPGAIRHRGPDQQAFLPGVALEEQGEDRQEQREGCHPLLLGQRPHLRHECTRQGTGEAIPPVGTLRRAGLIGRQLQEGRRPRQLPFPIGQLPFKGAPL